MSNYTPRTIEIRCAFANAETADFKIPREIAIAQFDRWLETHNAEVAKATEERIIKLLDTQVFVTTVFNWWNEVAKPNLHEGNLWESEVESLSDSLKSLIKGEQK